MSKHSKAPQPSYPPGIEPFIPPELTSSGEDCFTLNIWSPDLGSARLPVMVWIAGGLFEYHGTGASPWYNGSHFARDGVICVTINYRVDAEGFLFLDKGNANRGLLDQIAALQIEHITNEALDAVVAAYGLPVEAALATYRAAHPGAHSGDVLAALQGDWYWRIPTIRVAEAHAKHSSVTYMYEFAWRSSQFNGRLGACHGLEIAFVFDTLGNGTQSLADAMHAVWVAFATRGDPGWPRYELSRRATMHFDTMPKVVDDPQAAERVLWEGLR